MRRRLPEGTRTPLLYAVVEKLVGEDFRDLLDPDCRYRDGEVALAGAVRASVTPAELEVCRQVAAGTVHARDVLGRAPSREAVELASGALVEAAGVRWRGGGWTVIEDRP